MIDNRPKNKGGRPKGSRTRIPAPQPDPRRIVAYARIGSDERHPSLAKQESALRTHCVAHGLTLAAMHCDDGADGVSLRRAALDAALAMIQSGDAGALLVYSLDRLTTNVVDLSTLLETTFTVGGAQLLTIHGDSDAHTASGRMSLRMVTLVTQYQCETADES